MEEVKVHIATEDAPVENAPRVEMSNVEKFGLYPVETPEQLDAFKDKLRPVYGTLFSPSDFELFCMLPINESQRVTLVKKMKEEQYGKAEKA
jgi:hypothetical protein